MEQVYIKDKEGNKVLPITSESAVRDANGNPLSSKLGVINDALDNRYTKSETYSKSQLNSLITTPNQEYVSVTATAQTTDVTDVLPATGEKDTIYRVGNWDGSAYDITCYSEYAWDGTAYKFLSKKSQIGEVYDISAANGNETYTDLNDALTSNTGGVPSSLRKGGMSVKFVLTSDNKYVQYRLMVDTWSVDTNDWSFCGNDVYVENPEWIRVVTDHDGRILAGIKADGSIEWSLGVPTPVKEYVAFLLEGKVDKEEGKSLVPERYVQNIDSVDFLRVETDSDGRILSAIKKNGNYYIHNVESESLDNIKERIENIDGNTVGMKLGEDEYRLQVTNDNEKRVVSHRTKNGTLYENVGIKTPNFEILEDGISNPLPNFIRQNSMKIPYFDFQSEHEFRDISSYYNSFSISTDQERKNIPWMLYELYDAMALAYPDIVTKYDAMATEEVEATSSTPAILPISDIRDKIVEAGYNSYPFYFDGIESTSTRTYTYPNGTEVTKEYLPCPSYRPYIYRINYKNTNLHRGNTPKIPMVLIGGVHGNEMVSPLGLYMIVDGAIKCADSNLYSLGMIYDIYVIPYLNCYGCKNGTRINANGVDINRNFDYRWKYSDSDPSRYSGPYVGSEFETQLFMALVRTVKPKLFFDFHTYGGTIDYQYYAGMPDLKFSAPMYQAHNDCCYTFIKELPQCFGSTIQSFDALSAPALIETASSTINWAYHKEGVDSITLEVGQSIFFTGGVPQAYENSYFSLDVFKIADYTLRAGMNAICNYSLSK